MNKLKSSLIMNCDFATPYEVLCRIVDRFELREVMSALCEISSDQPSTIVIDMRRFILWRHDDKSGVSGTGLVACGTVLPGGRAVLLWLGKYGSITIHESMESLVAVHCHGGKSEVMFIDGEN